MYKDVNKYTNEEIISEFDEVIEMLKFDEYYKTDYAIVNLIRIIMDCGVDKNYPDDVLDIIAKVNSRRVRYDIDGKHLDIRSTNRKLVKSVIRDNEGYHLVGNGADEIDYYGYNGSYKK